MVSKNNSLSLLGIKPYKVDIEVSATNGLPCTEILGQVDKSTKESKERIKAAIKNSGFKYPASKIVINLCPANIRKQGTSFELAIAVSLLNITQDIKKIPSHSFFIGELALDGEIKGIRGVLPMLLSDEIKKGDFVFVPLENLKEALLVSGINIVPVTKLADLVEKINSGGYIKEARVAKNVELVKGNTCIKNDFKYVRGHAEAKRALEISACGNHSVLMLGSPGSGKTMLAKCMPGILPDLTYDESIELTKVRSILCDNFIEGLVTERPFVDPHHTVTRAALIGGGAVPRPGEITKAHLGVLFLDEFKEFNPEVIDSLRQPIEEKRVNISRLNYNVDYPSDFLLVCAANPCKCGYLYTEERCTCTPQQKQDYANKISGAMLDRIDIAIKVMPVDYDSMKGQSYGESSAEIKKRVERVRHIQKERYRSEAFNYNYQLPQDKFEQYCEFSMEAERILELAYKQFSFSAREYVRIVRLARTIADMDFSIRIEKEHLSEAMQFGGKNV